MGLEKENFNLSGAQYLTAIDWKNSHHRTVVASSLIQGVYVLERDRREQRQGPQALATPWWDFFHFRLIRPLLDDADHSIFGAIYEFKFPPSHDNYVGQTPPRYVIAFRGSSKSQDLKLDLQFVSNSLHKSPRFQVAMQAAKDIVTVAGAACVWLIGHSLGAAIALMAGKEMVKLGYPVETYLFNPPYFAAPIEKYIKNEKVKNGVRIAGSVITAGIATAVSSARKTPQHDSSFKVLSTWIPYLFVNPADPVCAEYVGYFAHREKMVKMGVGGIGKIATKHSFGSLVSNVMGKDVEPSHLIPSAYLTLNMNAGADFNDSHGIHQWWRADFQWDYKLHKYN